jgi:hypothetical protein
MNIARRVARAGLMALLAITFAIGPTVPATSAGADSVLSVRINWGDGTKDSWTLRCDPVGGTHPNRTAACAFLDGLAHPFSNKPTGLMCTMIYSGPETARVTGRWRGRPVDTRFARNDGCQTARWNEYRTLFTNPRSVRVSGRVDLGPTCPVERPGDVCTITGAPATVTATSGSRTRTTASGAQGFAMRLPRGVWQLTADAGMHCPVVEVDIRRGAAPGPVVIACDTGIRSTATVLLTPR